MVVKDVLIEIEMPSEQFGMWCDGRNPMDMVAAMQLLYPNWTKITLTKEAEATED